MEDLLIEFSVKNIANAFSIQMLSHGCSVIFTQISVEETMILLDKEVKSYIGHKDTALFVGNMLGNELSFCRENLKLDKGDHLIVAQVVGGRSLEGANTLPDGVKIEFWLVSVL